MSPSIIDGSLSYTWTNKDKISFKRIREEVKVLWSMTIGLVHEYYFSHICILLLFLHVLYFLTLDFEVKDEQQILVW
jgi:hypothetical protein